MPNDIPDWTSKVQVTPVGGLSGVNLGDVASPTLAIDQASVIANPDPQGATTLPIVMASLKAAAGQVIARVGALGAFLTGTNTAVNPQYGQAPTAGSWLGAWVESDTADATTVTAGWAKVVAIRAANGLAAAIWAKPVAAGGDAAPQFTAAGGLGPMTAQLIELSGVAASPTDQIASAASQTSGPLQITAPTVDAAFGDAILVGTHWGYVGNVTATFVAAINNGAVVVHAGDDGTTSQNHHASHDYGIVPVAAVAQPLGVADWAYDATGNSAPASGSQASVVLAATPGKTYTLAMLCAVIINASAAGANAPIVQVLDGATIIFQAYLASTATAGSGQVLYLTGLALKGTAGNSMTVRFSTAVAGNFESVSCGAYLR